MNPWSRVTPSPFIAGHVLDVRRFSIGSTISKSNRRLPISRRAVKSVGGTTRGGRRSGSSRDRCSSRRDKLGRIGVLATTTTTTTTSTRWHVQVGQ